MLRARVIPCLLIHKGGLVKTIRFADPKYLGDPINAVRILNEKQVDEIIVLDIDATVCSRPPDYDLISSLASRCRMPLCYGGGINTVEEIEKIISLGVEKVALSHSAVCSPKLISTAAKRVGSQSIVAVIDIRKRDVWGGYQVFTHNGKHKVKRNPIDLAKELVAEGAGEILINSIDRDGTRSGYDFNLVDSIRSAVNVPMTILGGAGSLDDLKLLIRRYGVIGAAAGSIFVLKGRYRAALIQYPQPHQKALISRVD